MRLAAAELVDSREILPGQWLQAYHAPAIAAGSRAGQFVHVRSGRLLRDHPAPPVLAQHGRSGDRHRDGPFPGHRPGHGLVHPAAAGRRDRPARAARAPVRGRPAQPPPAARRRRARDGRRPDARRRGDPRRPPGDPPVRGGVARARSTRPASCRTRSSTSWRPTTASLGHHGYVTELVAAVRGLGGPGVRLRPGRDARGPGAAGGRPARSARRGQAGSQAGRRQGRPGRVAGRATEGVPAGVDGAEHGLRGRGVPRLRGDEHVRASRSGSAARARCSPPRRSPGRAAGDGEASAR